MRKYLRGIDLFNGTFDARYVNLILSIPLRDNDSNIWFWNKEKPENYSVKTNYALIQENKEKSDSEASNRCGSMLWNLRVPPKVKHLIWRAATECLPTK